MVIHCMRTWRHYLLSLHFTIFIDNMATSCFASQKKLTPKQARWQDFIVEYDFTLWYKLGHATVVVDTLN